MNHKEFLKSINSDTLAELNTKSDAIGLINLFMHGGLILLFGGLIIVRVPGWQFLLLPQGILLIFLFTLLHETVHFTPFKSIRLNLIVGHICGFLIFLPAMHFRFFHLAHHRHTHDPEHDPELVGGKPETLLQYCWQVSGIPTWYFHLKTIFENALGRCDDPFIPKSKQKAIAMEARLMIVAYTAVFDLAIMFGVFEAIIYIWLIPLLVGQPFLRLYLMAEHGRCPHVANMFENTRTVFTSFIVRKLAWNMPYHAEHHACPTVPFHKLPRLHQLTKLYLKETESGYVSFHKKVLKEI